MVEPSPANSEWLTRKKLIDAALRAAGWRITPFVAGRSLDAWNACAVEEYQTANGPADYALIVGGRILGVVEAKKLSVGPQNVLVQAGRYAKGVVQDGLSFGAYGVPFLYGTNGPVIWFHDARHDLNVSRELAEFHTPEALVELLGRDLDASLARLSALPNDNPWLRTYQRDANAAIEDAIGRRKNAMLVAMATGTGKTFVMVNEVYRLMKAGVAKRVLFLVDRRALAAQAVKAFAQFDAEAGLKFDQVYEVYSQRFQRDDMEEQFDPKVLPEHYLTNPKAGSAFVYVSTIQRMTINLFGRDAVFGLGDESIDDDASKLKDIPIHAFDLIIADECHRGYTSSEDAVWRKTLDHFDAIKIGLTATPVGSTTAFFKEKVFSYPYERAVREGYLVDYDVVKVTSDVRLQGVFVPEGINLGTIDPETGATAMDMMEDERTFEAAKVEREITAPDSNRKILQEVAKYAAEHEARYGRFPKTLIFASNDLPHTSHADQLVTLARDLFGRGEGFVQKITGNKNVDRPLQRIREFRNRPQPGIVVTVDMLSTGVDIPDLEFIVFLRDVKSRVLFVQMIGRGTRKGEQLADKSHFVVFDCFDGTLLQRFKNATDVTLVEPTEATRSVSQIIDDIWANRDREYNTRCLVKRLQRIEKEMSGNARATFASYIPNGDMGAYAKQLPSSLRDGFTAAMELLRNKNFQDLLVNYERKPRTFFVAHHTEDVVASEWLVRGNDGKEYKPADYLECFNRFVTEHQTDIDAIGILLSRPQDWNPDTLQELRQKLTAAPQRFTLEHLERAHAITYQKALVDIISMVKHAADRQYPLLSSAERVERAFTTLTAGRTFTPEQLDWLDKIRTHLQENLSIDREDFETQPVFAREGGWGKATTVFKELPSLLKELNKVIAA
jgi:type I restriction enzyme R subunit